MRAVTKRIGALAAALALAGACAAAEEDDPVVVRVGTVAYTRSQVQSALDTDLSLYSMLNNTYYTEEDLAAQTEATLNRFVGVGLIENKLAEASLNDFTAEEEETLKAAAREQYEAYWQEAYRQLTESGKNPTEDEVTGMMNQAGYTVEAFYEEYLASERRNRAIDLFCPDVTITEEQVTEYYETMFVGPDREKYANDIRTYEKEVLAAGNESFYIPEGYRYIRQVLLDYPEEIARPLRNDHARLNTAMQGLAAAIQDLAAAAASAEGWDDLAGPRAAYEAAAEEAQAARNAYDEKRKALAQPLVQEILDEIYAQCAEGVDFLDVIRSFSTDKTDRNLAAEGGYPFHPDSDQWPENFRAAASALEKPGDVSEPVYTDRGIHILYYAGDVPAGEHVLTQEERETLNAAALYYAQSQKLEKLFEEWKKEYETETHPELMNR